MRPKFENLLQVNENENGEQELPWEINDWWEKNDADQELYVKRYKDLTAGKVKSVKEINEQEKKSVENWKKKINTKHPEVPENILTMDEEGTKYATTHRCFGKPCNEPKNDKYTVRPKESSLVELEQPRGRYEAERDKEADYPADWTTNPYPVEKDEDLRKFVHQYIGQNGRLKTENEVELENEAEDDKKFKEASEKTAFKLKPGIVDDWSGQRFATTHRCFGERCKEDKTYLQLDTEKKHKGADSKARAFKLGDLQEHRYSSPRAWKKDAWPATETVHQENVMGLVSNYYDPVKGRWKSHWEVMEEEQNAIDAAIEAWYRGGGYTNPHNIIDDWTGSKYLEPCHGHYPCQQSLTQHHKKHHHHRKNLVQLDSSIEPYDPNLADVEKIMDRYKQKDKKEAEEQARMQLGDDPNGGIDKIALAALKRDQPVDNREISKIAYDYMTGAKD